MSDKKVVKAIGTNAVDTFNIAINAPEGRIYNFSGPINPPIMELREAAFKLLEEFIIRNWQTNLINREKEEAVKAEAVKAEAVKTGVVKEKVEK